MPGSLTINSLSPSASSSPFLEVQETSSLSRISQFMPRVCQFLTLQEIMAARPASTFFQQKILTPLSGSFAISLREFSSIEQAIRVLRVLQAIGVSIHTLDLSGFDQLTVVQFTTLIALTPNIHTMALNHCAQISDEAMITLGSTCRQIRAVFLCGCQLLTGVSLAVFQADKIQEIDLSGCARINNEDIIALLNRYQRLTKLILSYCERITIHGLAAALQTARIRTIVLRGCEQIADEDIEILITACPKAEVIDVTDCMQITKNTLTTFRASKPHIQLISNYSDS